MTNLLNNFFVQQRLKTDWKKYGDFNWVQVRGDHWWEFDNYNVAYKFIYDWILFFFLNLLNLYSSLDLLSLSSFVIIFVLFVFIICLYFWCLPQIFNHYLQFCSDQVVELPNSHSNCLNIFIYVIINSLGDKEFLWRTTLFFVKVLDQCHIWIIMLFYSPQLPRSQQNLFYSSPVLYTEECGIYLFSLLLLFLLLFAVIFPKICFNFIIFYSLLNILDSNL